MVKIFLVLLSLVWADQPLKLYAHKVFSEVSANGAIHVLVFSNGHLAGRPFTIHLRAECGKTGQNWRKLDLKIADSACFVDRNAIEMNRGTHEIFVKTYELDYADYDKQLMSNPTSMDPKCAKEPTIVRFEVKDLCNQD